MSARLLALTVVLACTTALTACEDRSACTERDALRCSADGRALERCAPIEGGALHWASVPCPTTTPTCAAGGPREAVCVAERVGECRFQGYVDRCVDEHTLEDCAAFRPDAPAGVLHRIACPGRERCGEVPAHAIAEGRASTATHACFAPRARVTPEAIVTFVHGDVRLGDRPAPPVPFRVPPRTRLHLAEGARVVALVKELPLRLAGPGDVDVYEQQPEDVVPTEEAARIVAILSRPPPPSVPPAEPLLSPAPSETGLVRVLLGEGVPGASANLPPITWQCEQDCGRTIELRSADHTDRVLWRGMGERTVIYAGPELEPDRTYELRVGERTYRVETQRAQSYRELMARMQDWPLVESMSVVAALHVWGGSRSAAVALLQRTHIERLRADLDVMALLAAYGEPIR